MPDLSESLIRELKAAGAVLVGFADLRPVKPRPMEHLPFGVSIALPFAEPALARRPGRPKADPEYIRAYFRSRRLPAPLAALGADMLKSAGYEAWSYGGQTGPDPHADKKDEMNPDLYLTATYQQKTTARLAGLGWVGRMGVLVTREYGPHVWLGSIFTDAPLPTAEPLIEHQCGSCRKCQEACPVGAVKGPGWRAGLAREDLVDIKACQAHRLERGRDAEAPMCGLCLAACPFGRGHFPAAE